jgi:hypothetical protein
MITPTVGRVVLFIPGEREERHFNAASRKSEQFQPLAAIITHVHSDALVNLAVFSVGGIVHGRENVLLVQDRAEYPKMPNFEFCEWMPFQKGQAKKTEQTTKEMLQELLRGELLPGGLLHKADE